MQSGPILNLPGGRVDYLMIEKLQMIGFRCFKNLSLSGLKRVNIIVGKNSTGKTALLEGLFLASGSSPELYFKTRAWRGMGPLVVQPYRSSYEELFKNIFFNFDTNSVAQVHFTDSFRSDRSVTISFRHDDTGSMSLPLDTEGKADALKDSSIVIPIVFRWKSNLSTHESQVTVTSDDIKATSSTDVYPAVFLSSLPINSDAVQRFSKLSRARQLAVLVSALRRPFPQIDELSVEIESGVSSIYAGIQGLPEKVPLAMVSGGISKYLSILLAISDAKRGAVFIDEIENGIYYDVLETLLETSLYLCKEYESQLFITTHSIEFLRSIAPLIEKYQDEFLLIRTQRDNGHVRASQFDGARLLGALEQGFDVR